MIKGYVISTGRTVNFKWCSLQLTISTLFRVLHCICLWWNCSFMLISVYTSFRCKCVVRNRGELSYFYNTKTILNQLYVYAVDIYIKRACNLVIKPNLLPKITTANFIRSISYTAVINIWRKGISWHLYIALNIKVL